MSLVNNISYQEIYTQVFLKNLKRYSAIKEQAKKKIDRIISNPYHNTEPLQDKSHKRNGQNLLGFRSCRIDRNFRIIFVICEEWIKLKQSGEKAAECPGCEEFFKHNVKTLIFLTVGPHDKSYQD
ncbi:MAG: hypothetical protein ACD_79C00182G0011 [uncultured bacterium]|nr:MAG: hypothetical protein ACD_79C00182G0011 [uncultured bacterium]